MKEWQKVTLPTLMTLIEVLGAFVIIAFFSYWPFTLGFCFLSYFLPPYLPSLFYSRSTLNMLVIFYWNFL